MRTDPIPTGVCSVCGEKPWCDMALCFPELQGEPMVCSRCVYEKLTSIKLTWRTYGEKRADD
jgi:hypothetical protein